MLNSINDSNEITTYTIDETDNDLCRALWLSVILQALTDAQSQSAKRYRRLDRLKALHWISGADNPNSDFSQVCEFASIDRAKMKRKIDRILSGQEDSIDFRCLKKLPQAKRSWEQRTKFLKRTKLRKEALLKAKLLANNAMMNQVATELLTCRDNLALS